MEKKITNIKISIEAFGINTKDIYLAEKISEQITSFCTNKMKELNPDFKVNVKVDKSYTYRKEPEDGEW